MMKRWFSDTLSKRLLLLMWAALVGSHVLAYAVVHVVVLSANGPARLDRLPTFPSLPPTPGLPDDGPGGPPPEGRPGEPPPHFGPPPAQHAPPRPGLPTPVLLLDYGVRFAVIALAAWFGSRWLAAPMRRLVTASRGLSRSVAGDGVLPALDPHSGTREVRETAEVFNAMAAQLREQFQSRGLMVSAISHDLRTPLTRLRMRLEAMPGDAELQQRCVNDIVEMDTLIDNTLALFRPGGGDDGEPMQDTDVFALVQSLVDDLAEQGRPVTIDGEPAVTRAKPAALRRVVGNLLGNALRYGERAEVQVRSTADHVRITVDDAGPGIPADQLEAVFRPFYRVEASRNRNTGGTGLGLYIARDLAQRQGGELSLHNRAEGGLRAELRLRRG